MSAAVIGLSCASHQLKVPFALTGRQFELKSGLRVVAQEDHSDPVVTVASSFGSGGTADPSGKEGLAHMVEHLTFRARPQGGLQVWDRLHRMGATFNAYTSADATLYFATVPRSELRALLELQAWRMLDPLAGVTPDVFEAEREVVRSELRQGRETGADAAVFDTLKQALFPPGHPLARPVVGTHESLSALTLDDARRFVRQNYRPANAVIVVAGDVERAEIGRLLGTWPAHLLFGADGPAGAPTERSWPGLRAAPGVPNPVVPSGRLQAPVAQPELVVAWSLPGGYRGNDAMLMFARGLVDMVAAQVKKTADDEDEIESIGTDLHRMLDASVIAVTARLRPGADPGAAKERIVGAVGEAWTRLSSLSKRLEDLGTALVTSSMLSSDQLTTRTQRIAEFLSATGRAEYFAEMERQYRSAEGSSLTEFAFRWIKPERAVSVYVEPESKAGDRPLRVDRDGPAPRRAAGDAKGTDPAEDLGPARILQVAAAPGLASIRRARLTNGLVVVSRRRAGAPVVEVELLLGGGEASVTPYGVASLAHTMLKETSTYRVPGTWYARSVGPTDVMWRIQVPSPYLTEAVGLIGEDATRARVIETTWLVDYAIKKGIRAFERSATRPEFAAHARLRQELYPGHPYGRYGAVPRDWGQTTAEDLSAFVQSQYRPDNAVLFVIGDVDDESARAVATAHFGAWKAGHGEAPELPQFPTTWPTRRKLFLLERPGATQAEIMVGCRLARPTADDLPMLHVAERVVDEAIWKVVREGAGATYGIASQVEMLPGAAAVLLHGAVDAAHAGTSLSSLLEVLDDVGRGTVSEDLFLQARWDVARSFWQRFSGSRELAASLRFTQIQNWPDSTWDRYPGHLAETTRDSFQRPFATCLGKEIITLVGDASSLAPQLAAIGMSPEPPAP